MRVISRRSGLRSEWRIRMWYVMQVQTGNEEMIIKLCEQVINTRKYERIFLPKCVTLKKRRGEWKELIQTLFPGYIFIDTDENRITDIIRACYAIPEVTKVLRSAENFTSIHELEQTYLREMMDDEDIVRPSVGYQVGEHVEILSGPLRYGHAKICYVDRHKRVAEIEVELFGRYTKAKVALEVIGKTTEENLREEKLKQEQQRDITKQQEQQQFQKNMESWKAGDTVQITSGTFEGIEGTFVSVDTKRQEVKAKIRLFERETEVVLGGGEVVVVG